MRLNVSCLLTDFSYFETFWSEFKPENGQLVQNKADTKAYVGVFSILFSVRFVLKLALYLCCTWVVFPWHKEYLYGGRQAYTGGFPSCRHNFKVELWSVGTLHGGFPPTTSFSCVKHHYGDGDDEDKNTSKISKKIIVCQWLLNPVVTTRIVNAEIESVYSNGHEWYI